MNTGRKLVHFITHRITSTFVFFSFSCTLSAQANRTQYIYNKNTDAPAKYVLGQYSIDTLVIHNAVIPWFAVYNYILQNVRVRVEIDTMGQLTNAVIADSSLSMFHEEALRLAYRAKSWQPALVNQKPVNVFDTILISFEKHFLHDDVSEKYNIFPEVWRPNKKLPDGKGVIFGTCESKQHSWESATNGDQYVFMFNMDSMKVCGIRVLENSIHKTGNFYYVVPAGRYRLIKYSYWAHFGYWDVGYRTELLVKNMGTQQIDSLMVDGKKLLSDFTYYEMEVKAGEFTYVGYWNFFGPLVEFRNELETFRSKNVDNRKKKSTTLMNSVSIPK